MWSQRHIPGQIVTVCGVQGFRLWIVTRSWVLSLAGLAVERVSWIAGLAVLAQGSWPLSAPAEEGFRGERPKVLRHAGGQAGLADPSCCSEFRLWRLAGLHTGQPGKPRGQTPDDLPHNAIGRSTHGAFSAARPSGGRGVRFEHCTGFIAGPPRAGRRTCAGYLAGPGNPPHRARGRAPRASAGRACSCASRVPFQAR